MRRDTLAVIYCALPLSIVRFFILFPPRQFWISCPSWWCHILWFLPAWRRPPFPWQWARWTDWARWPAWPTWRSSTPSPPLGLPPLSLRWTQRTISAVEPTTSQSPCLDTCFQQTQTYFLSLEFKIFWFVYVQSLESSFYDCGKKISVVSWLKFWLTRHYHHLIRCFLARSQSHIYLHIWDIRHKLWSSKPGWLPCLVSVSTFKNN